MTTYTYPTEWTIYQDAHGTQTRLGSVTKVGERYRARVGYVTLSGSYATQHDAETAVIKRCEAITAETMRKALR